MNQVRPPLVLRVRALPGQRARGRLHVCGLVLPCALGPSGIRRDKREGDGATPAGRFVVLQGWFRPDRRRPRCGLTLRPLRPGDGWCDDPGHRLYNRAIRRPFASNHEGMWREDRLYDVVFATSHNERPRVKGRGSGIFFHLARPGFTPTQGCVAISADAMRRLLPRLRGRVVLDIG